MQIFKNKNKVLYGSLIITFAILYGFTAFVSWYHAITFFNIANPQWLSIILSFVAEIGQMSILFSLLLTKNKHKLLPWFIMIVLTSLQVIGNVVSSYKFIQTSTTMDFQYFQQSILFWVENTNSQMFKVIIAWITGGILPVVALSMTALVAENISLVNEEVKSVETIISDNKIQDEIAIEEENLIENANYNIPDVNNNDDKRLEKIIENEVQKRLAEANERAKKEEKADNSLENLLESETNGDILSLSEIENANSIMAQYIDNDKYRYTYIPAVDEPVINEVISEVKPEIVDEVKELAVPVVYTQEEVIEPVVEKPIIKKPKLKPKPPINKVPVNKISGWHLMKEFVDNDGNIFNRGKFVKHDKKRKPTEPKKA